MRGCGGEGAFKLCGIDAAKGSSGLGLRQVPVLLGFGQQIFPKIGMRNSYQRQAPLPNGFTVQVGRAIFRSDIFDIGTRHRHARPRRQRKDHIGAAVQTLGGQDHYGFATGGETRSLYRVVVTPDAAKKLVRDGICRDLTRQVDLEGTDNTNEIVNLAQHLWITGITEGMEFNDGIAIQKVVEFKTTMGL